MATISHKTDTIIDSVRIALWAKQERRRKKCLQCFLIIFLAISKHDGILWRMFFLLFLFHHHCLLLLCSIVCCALCVLCVCVACRSITTQKEKESEKEIEKHRAYRKWGEFRRSPIRATTVGEQQQKLENCFLWFLVGQRNAGLSIVPFDLFNALGCVHNADWLVGMPLMFD